MAGKTYFCTHCQTQVSRATFYRHASTKRSLLPFLNEYFENKAAFSDLDLFLSEILYSKVKSNVSTKAFDLFMKSFVLYHQIVLPATTFNSIISRFNPFLPKYYTIPVCSHCELPCSDWIGTPKHLYWLQPKTREEICLPFSPHPSHPHLVRQPHYQ